MSKIPVLTALVYNHIYNNDRFVEPRSDLDWTANFMHMIGK